MANRPNIVYIFADQLRYDALLCNGNQQVKTPNIDKIAQEALSFDCAFSSCPLCSPYRAQVLTGRYAHQNGVVCNEYKLRSDLPTLPKCLKEHGYSTAFIGKWHLGNGPYREENSFGFDRMLAYHMCADAYCGEYYDNEKGPFPYEKWLPEQDTDMAIDFMRSHTEQRKENPFFLMMSWIPPHWPYHTFPKEFDLYNPDEMSVPGNVPEEFVPFERKELAMYYANVTALDFHLGRIVKTLSALGIAEDTILCFTSDHGDHLGAHGYGKPFSYDLHHTKRASKATPYSESIHVPFLLKYPRLIHETRRSDVIFNSVDVMPTLLRLADVDVPDSVSGKDLAFVAENKPGKEPESAYFQILGPGWPYRGDWVGFWRGVRNKRYTYAKWYRDEVSPMLFDTVQDPLEKNNLYGKPEYLQVQREMEQKLNQWIAKTEDPFFTGKRDPETHMLQLGQEFANDSWNRHRS